MTAPVAFVCAMPMELKPLRKRLGLRRERTPGGDVWTGALDGRPVVAVVTGMGTELATAGTERLLARATPAHVLVVGITGAVENETPIGTLVLPEVVVNSETGTSYAPTALGDRKLHGTMWTTNVITPPEELPGLRARGVVSLDMETAAIGACCDAQGVPWSVFRAISDRASDGSVDEEIFKLSNQDGTPNPRAVVRYFARHPLAVPRMARLAKGASLATTVAATAAIAAVASIPDPGEHPVESPT
jgi:adenosylhomocysteine nucleosidase